MKFRYSVWGVVVYLITLAGAILALAYSPESSQTPLQDVNEYIDTLLQQPTIRLLVESLMFIP